MRNTYLKLVSIMLSIAILFSAMSTSALATENTTQTETTQKIDVVANALNLSTNVKNAINKNFSDNASVSIATEETLPNIPLNNKYYVSNAGYWNYDDILISKEYGTMSYSKELFSLDGVNGLTTSLGLHFDSDSSIYNNDANNEENETYNFYDSKYNLGVGWSLSLPAIEIVNNTKYLHTASGEKFKISSENKLEGHLLNDVTFSTAKENEFTYNSVAAVYKLTDINNTSDYFAADGKYLGTQDFLGNKIKVAYNSEGLIQKIIDPAGRYFGFIYKTTETGRQVIVKLFDKGTNPSSKTLYTLNQTYTNGYYSLTSIKDAINRVVSFDYLEFNNNITNDGQTVLEKSINLCGIENYNGAYTGIEYQTKQTSYESNGVKDYKVVSRCFKKDTKTSDIYKLSTVYDYSFNNAVNWRNNSSAITVTCYENTCESTQTEVSKDETTIDKYSRVIKERQYLCSNENVQTDENITEYSNFTVRNQPTVITAKTMGKDGAYLFTRTTNTYNGYGSVLDSKTVSGEGSATSEEDYSTFDSKSSNSYNYNLSKTIPIISVEFTKAENNAVFATATFNTISDKTGKITSTVTKTYDMTNINSLSELTSATPVKKINKTTYTYATSGNLTKEVQEDLTLVDEENPTGKKQTTSYTYETRYNAYIAQTNQSGIVNSDGISTGNVNGSADIVSRSEYDMFGRETVSYDTYGNKTFKDYDDVDNLIRTGQYSTPYQTIFDWEGQPVGTSHPNISGLNSDTSKWSANFEITSDTSHLASGSNQGIKITQKVNYTTECRVALSVTSALMENSLGIRMFVATPKNYGGIKLSFKNLSTSMYYDVHSSSHKQGSWITVYWNGRMYKNGPDTYGYVNGTDTELQSTRHLWIAFKEMAPGEVAYLDDIQVIKNTSGTEIETISSTEVNYQTNTTITSNKDGTGSKTITDNFGNVIESYEKLPNGNYKKVSETTYNNSFQTVSTKNYVSSQAGKELYTTTDYTYNAKGETIQTVVKDQNGEVLSTSTYSNDVDLHESKLYNISTDIVTTSKSGETRTTTTTSYADASGNNIKTVKVAELTDELSALDSKTTEEYNIYGSFGELLQNSGDETQTEQYVQDSTGETVITAYGTENQTVESTVTDGFGQTISESDANTNEGKELDPNDLDEESGVITKYDAAGRVIETQTPFSKNGDEIVYSVVKTDYDANGNVIRERTRKDGNTYYDKINSYDAENNLIMVQQKNGSTSQYTQYLYDDNNRVIRIYSGLSKSLSIISEDNIETNGDEDYAVIGYTYDFYGNKTSYTDQFGKTEYYEYNLYSGFLDKVTKRDGTQVTYTYDVNGNVLSTIAENNVKDSIKKTYTYNSENMVKTATTSRKAVGENEYVVEYITTYHYDMNGNIYNERTTNNLTNNIVNKAYEYDDKSNVTKLTVSKVQNNESSLLYQYDYTYFEDDNVKDEIVTVAGNSAKAKISYTYDANGNVLTKASSEVTADSSTAKVSSTYTYNLSNICVTESHNNGSGYSFDYSYTYTPDGNMTKSRFTRYEDVLETIYTYDNLNRLTSEEQKSASGKNAILTSDFKDTYAFDDFNNITLKSHTEDGNNYTQTSAYNKTRLVSQEKAGSINNQITYTYDDNGNMATKSSVTGEFTSSTDFDYDAFDRTSSIEIDNAETSFVYDCDDDRVVKTTGTKATESILDNGNISADLVGNTVKVFTADNSVYCENGVFTYNIVNSKGDLASTAGSSNVDYKYNAYGEKLVSANTNNPIGYRNYYYDSETGLYYLKARYYDSSTGQFTQEDIVQDDNLQYNLYGYCSGNPVLYVDPSGQSLLVIGGLIILAGTIMLTTTSCSDNNYYEIPAESRYNPSGQSDFYADGSAKQNCYGFALDKKTDKSPGYKSGINYTANTTLNKTFEYVKSDLTKLGYKYKDNIKKEYTPKKNETKICLRKTSAPNGDYHLMRYKKGVGWLHKPGRSDVLKLADKKKPWQIGNWICEGTYDEGKTWSRNTYSYDSKIKYLVYYK